MEFRKIVLMNLFAGKTWRTDCGHSQGRRQWDGLTEPYGHVYTAAAAAESLSRVRLCATP